MSSLSRIISGTSSGLTRNFFTLIITALSLPIYLSFWSLDLYGTWILIITIITILKIPIFSYQEYLGNEFLKLGKKNKKEISRILYGSAIIIFIYSIILISLIFLLLNFSNLLHFFKIDKSVVNEAKKVIIILLFADLLGVINGLYTRVLYPFHYYPKLNWIGLIIVVTIPVCQIFSVTLGFGILGLSIVTLFTENFLNIIYFIYLKKMIIKEKISFIKFNFIKNLNHFKNSFYLVIGKLTRVFRETGVRLILAPLLGTIQMISYVAIKTASNFMAQIFSSFTSSLLIEFVGYINEKDKDKFLHSYTILYLIFCLIVTPFAFFLQIFAPIIFEVWTRDKIIFDTILFASLTSSFLVMVFYQPAIMIVQGKNLFKEDLLISILTSIIFVILLVFFINNYSIKGAGYSLLITELFSCLFFFYFANNWLKKKFVTFRNKIIVVPITDLTITIILIFSYLIFNNSSEHIIIIYIITKLIVILIFWNVLSKIIKKKIIKSFDLIINFKNKL